MDRPLTSERIQTVVIGAGQAGLATGYHLARLGLPFVILDANARIGDSWRRRWDSLRLFTTARFDGLAGMPFPAPSREFPTKDEMADYLEAYARRFALPVKSNTRVERVSREGRRYIVEAGGRRYEADHVVVAMANYQVPRTPSFSADLRSDIVQLHSFDYRNPAQLRPGPVLLVGAGNSGSEIAMEVLRDHKVFMSGRDTGYVPFRISNALVQVLLLPLLFKGIFHHVLTVRTPIGRRVRSRILGKGGPLIRVQPRDLSAAGVERVGKVTGVKDGRPVLADGRVLDVTNVVWCTGFEPGFSWIDLPVFGDHGEPRHERGVATGEPGLYFVGLHFLYSMSSAMIHGVSRDAKRIVGTIRRRVNDAAPADSRTTSSVRNAAPAGS